MQVSNESSIYDNINMIYSQLTSYLLPVYDQNRNASISIGKQSPRCCNLDWQRTKAYKIVTHIELLNQMYKRIIHQVCTLRIQSQHNTNNLVSPILLLHETKGVYTTRVSQVHKRHDVSAEYCSDSFRNPISVNRFKEEQKMSFKNVLVRHRRVTVQT